jgi:uncharacterized protein YciI
MLYAIYCEDVPGTLAIRKQTRPAHLERLQHLRLVLAGPFPAVDCIDPGDAGFTGSLIVAEFDSLAAAVKWAEQDPYQHAGVYASVTVKPYKKVFPS